MQLALMMKSQMMKKLSIRDQSTRHGSMHIMPRETATKPWSHHGVQNFAHPTARDISVTGPVVSAVANKVGVMSNVEALSIPALVVGTAVILDVAVGPVGIGPRGTHTTAGAGARIANRSA